ncbi:MAG: TonB-dependent receptor plug domain-containing protein [Paludibacteraceae bacterium]|nr:TonB-dependent receptor plug domain-containing protein [Paludibacteraceae bacterium]
MKRLVCLALFALPLYLWAKNPTISGYVTDVQTGERLIGATVQDVFSGAGTVTNVHGFYSLTLPADSVSLQAGYVGYEPLHAETFMLHADTLVEMNLISVNVLDEVVVQGSQSISGVQSVQMSAVEVPVSQIKGIPAIGGEVDILKAIQLLPGVQSGSEGSAGIYVRGGGPDENLIMLDGVPLYSVNHMFGFFSVFNADAVKNVTLYEGNFPARYGGRLSSIIDVRQKDGDAYGYHGNLTVGIISTKLSVEGPIYWNKEDWRKFRNKEAVKAQTTFNISARRTLYDLFVAPIAAAVTTSTSGGEQTTTGGYYFYDLNAKLTHTFSENDKLSGSFYMGDDVIYARIKSRDLYDDSYSSYMNMRYNWGNLFGAVNYEHRFNGRLYNTSQISYTRYKYNLGVSMEVDDKLNKENTNGGLRYDSYIMDLMAQTNFEWRPNNRHEVHFGGSYTFHTFRPQVGRIQAEFATGKSSSKMDTTFSVGGTNYAHEANIYLEETYTPCSWFKANIGVHAGLFHTDGKTYPSIEPRVGLRFLPYKDFAIKMSYAYMSQYVHMLSNSSVSLPTDLWVPVTAKIPPMHSMQVAAGLSYNVLNQVELSVEGYYKKMINLLEYKDGASYMSAQNWQELVCVGDGWSYGVQLLAQRKIGPVTGWIGYTWSRTMRQFDREGQEINFGKPFHAKYDREHDLSITLQYQINKKWEIASTFIYGTGTRGTLALQRTTDYMFWGNGKNINLPIIEERNNYKMPDYHRLDLGATCHMPGKKHPEFEHIVNMSVYNVYCNFNPFLVYASGGHLYKFSLFPILPSVSYTFKF